MPSCPCCRKPLTDAQVRSIWASYCSTKADKSAAGFASMTPERRREIAKAAAAKRWSKKKPAK